MLARTVNFLGIFSLFKSLRGRLYNYSDASRVHVHLFLVVDYVEDLSFEGESHE